MNIADKTDNDADRERSLIDQWGCLTEERNAVLVPVAGSCIPGAPADWWVLTGVTWALGVTWATQCSCHETHSELDLFHDIEIF